jgi:hypothetical protein
MSVAPLLTIQDSTSWQPFDVSGVQLDWLKLPSMPAGR